MVLKQSCSSRITAAVACTIGNAAGYVSSTIWLCVLLPQLYLNYKRKSTLGLSLLWALANFTASFINLFFVFRLGLPLFSKVMAVYMPVVESLLLGQFVCYGTAPYSHCFWITWTLACLIWLFTALLSLFVPASVTKLEWVAIALWSIELFPQLFLNFRRSSTSGQATLSVMLSFVGKTTDFLAAYLLDMPLQTAILAYFSSTTAYLNILQFFYYRLQVLSTDDKDIPCKTVTKISYYLFCGVVVMGLAAMIYALEWRCYFEIWTILLPLAVFLTCGCAVISIRMQLCVTNEEETLKTSSLRIGTPSDTENDGTELNTPTVEEVDSFAHQRMQPVFEICPQLQRARFTLLGGVY